MTWSRLEDDMDDNRKLQRLSDGAFRLYWIAIPWARRHKTGGRLYEADVEQLCAKHRLRNPKRLIAELLEIPYDHEAGCWHQVGRGAYEIHDFDKYNPPTSAERMARKRARERDESVNGVTQEVTPSDADVTSHTVTPPVTSDAQVTPGVTPSDGPSRARLRAGYPDPVPEPVTTGLRPSVTPPVVPLPETVSPLLARRVELLRAGCMELLKRPLRGDERPVILGWAALERDGEPVGVDEILCLVAHLLSTPTRDGTPPGTLRYCDATVLALARAPWNGAAAEGPSFVALAEAMESGAPVEPRLRLAEGGAS